MREIKYRGKSNGEWVFGAYLYDKIHDRHFILTHDEAGNIRENKVNPETVGQFINVKDIKNVEAYNGDIVECVGYQRKFRAEIVWWEMNCCFELWNCTKGGGVLHEFINDNADHEEHGIWTLEIIGNKTDNPELLK